MDPTLHKFIAICQRIFKVPVVLISMADVNKQWMISKVGLEVMQKDEIVAFSALILSPDIPDVLIVADALSDERFSSNLLVTEFPFIRFYACAAVIVEDVRIGSLCIFNSKARHDFCEEDKMNLLDFGSAVSSFITSQRMVTMAINDQKYVTTSIIIEKNNFMVDMMHQVRTPLMTIQLNASLVESSQIELAEYLKEDDHGTKLSNKLANFLSDLKSGISQLDTFVTSSVKLVEEPLIQSDNNNNNNINRTTKDVLTQFHWNDLFLTIERNLTLLSHSIEVEWHVDDKLIHDDASMRSYPEIIKGILSFLSNNVMTHWKKAMITVHFISYQYDTTTTATTTTTVVSNVDNNNILNCSTTSGYLTMMINMCQPHDTSTTTITTTDSIPLFIDLQSIQRQLIEIGGHFRTVNFDASSSSSSSSSYFESSRKVEEQFFECCLPCELSLPSPCYNYNNNNIILEKIAYSLDIEQKLLLKKEPYINNKLCCDLSNHSLSSSLHKPLKILIVDDSIAIYKVLKRWLETEGCDVTVAENGWIGLTYLKTQSFDITLMDFIMPVMLGRDAMRLFQEWKLESCLNNINDDMLLVGMSANATQRDQDEAYQYGMHFFASKPVDLDFLSIILSAKSKCQSLPKAVQEITLKKAKTNTNSNTTIEGVVGDPSPNITTTTTTSNSKSTAAAAASSIPICIQRKRDRIKKSSQMSRRPYHHQLPSTPSLLTHHISINSHDHVSELTTTATNFNFYLSSTIDIAVAEAAKRKLQKPPQSSFSHTSSSWNFQSQFRRFSHYFSDPTSRTSKIIPSIDPGTAGAGAGANAVDVITDI